MCRSTSSLVRRPTTSSKQARARLQVGRARTPPACAPRRRPRARRPDVRARREQRDVPQRSKSRRCRAVASRPSAPARSRLADASRPSPVCADTSTTAIAIAHRRRRGRSCLFATIRRAAFARLVEQTRDRRQSAAPLRSSTTQHEVRRRRAPASPARHLRARRRRCVSRSPAVSTSVTAIPSMSTRSVTRSRVVPGTAVTMARSASSRAH